MIFFLFIENEETNPMKEMRRKTFDQLIEESCQEQHLDHLSKFNPCIVKQINDNDISLSFLRIW